MSSKNMFKKYIFIEPKNYYLRCIYTNNIKSVYKENSFSAVCLVFLPLVNTNYSLTSI
jgi:hypothetical protein